MKNKLFRTYTYVSAILFFGFLTLYIYTLVFSPNSSSFITIKHSNPLITTNYPSKKISVDDPNSIHIAVEKNDVDDMSGCYLILFNQGMPYEYNVVFAPFVPSGLTNETRLNFLGYRFASFQHIGKMLGTSDGDRERDTIMAGNGIYFTHMLHTVEKKWDWWTLMISLWYPIILFGILPAIFVIKKLRDRKPAPTKETAIEK